MALTDEQIERYSRHIILKEVGAKGQKKLLNAKVLIIGAGPTGICTLLSVMLKKPRRIIVCEKDKNRLQFIRQHYPEILLVSPEKCEAFVRANSDHGGADVVLEVAGAEATFRLAWECARPNAIVTVVALYDKAQVLPDHRRREHHAEQVAQGQDADAQFRHQHLGLLKQVVTERDEEQPLCDAGSADAVHDMGHEVRVGEDGGFQFQLDGAALHFFTAGQRFVQSGQSFGGEADAVPFGQVDGAQLTDGQVVDLGGELGADVDEVVVVDDEAMVAGLLDVHLNAVGTEVNGVAEGGQGVFGGKIG